MSSDFYVQKADGSKQLFDRVKVIKTCLRFGANHQIADEIAHKIEQRIWHSTYPFRTPVDLFFFRWIY